MFLCWGGKMSSVNISADFFVRKGSDKFSFIHERMCVDDTPKKKEEEEEESSSLAGRRHTEKEREMRGRSNITLLFRSPSLAAVRCNQASDRVSLRVSVSALAAAYVCVCGRRRSRGKKHKEEERGKTIRQLRVPI